MLRKILISSVCVYLGLGLVIGLFLYNQDLNTFECLAPDEPHGYITIFRSSGGNPDPEKCTSHGTRLKSLIKIPAAMAIGPPLIVFSVLRKRAERELINERGSGN